METLTLEILSNCNGGTNWGKVLGGVLETAGGVIAGGASSWTGVGLATGGVVAADGIGRIIDGFED